MSAIRFSIWLVASWFCCAGSAHAALVTRFVTEPPATMSTVSRFPVSVELYDTTAGARVNASGVTITLNLYRCPGYPSSCSVTVVQNGFASAATVSGLATFNNLTIDTANTDYYFSSNATGFSIDTSEVRDVEQAVLRYSVEPQNPASSVSRLDLQVRVHVGTGIGAPVDTYADGVGIRLGLYRCPGYPASCSVSIIDPNFANGTANNGQASIDNVVIDTPATDYYFFATTPSETSTGTTSEVFDVEQAVLRWSTEPQDPSSTVSRIDLQVRVHVGTAVDAPVDASADGVGVRLALYRCPGYPASCSVVIINTNFANASANSGVANFFNLLIEDVATDYYFFATTPTDTSTGSTSDVFDVVQPVLRFSVPPMEPVSTASRMDLQVSVHVGPAVDAPVDAQADNVPVRLALYRCPGYPASCSVTVIDTNFANGSAVNGVAGFNNLVIGSDQTDYYFFSTTPDEGATGSTSPVFDVVQARVRLPDPAVLRFVDVPFDYPLEIVAGPGVGAPVDLQADGVGVRLALYRCPGYPASCSVIIQNTNFANAVANNGVVTFGGLAIGTAATDYYFFGTVPGETGVDGSTGTVFDVEIDPFVFGDGFETL